MPQFSFSQDLGVWTNNENPSETIGPHTKLRLKIASVSLLQKSVVRNLDQIVMNPIRSTND